MADQLVTGQSTELNVPAVRGDGITVGVAGSAQDTRVFAWTGANPSIKYLATAGDWFATARQQSSGAVSQPAIKGGVRRIDPRGTH